MQTQATEIKQTQPLVGVSACLLGHEVRFNGGHARNRYVTDILDKHCTWLPLCPEMGIGMGAPRETLRLVDKNGQTRLMGAKSGTDYTDALDKWTAETLGLLRVEKIHGFVLKKKSPSCGMARLPIYDGKGGAVPNGVGLFAQALMIANPLLPMEEDGRLFDPGLRERFLVKLYAYKRWCDFSEGKVTPSAMVTFHTRHKLLLMGHHPQTAKELGQLVASIGKEDVDAMLPEYGKKFMACLDYGSSRRQKAHTLLQIARHLRLPKDDLSEISNTLNAFKKRQLPLAAPLTLLRHHLRREPEFFSGITYYLDPYPRTAAGPAD